MRIQTHVSLQARPALERAQGLVDQRVRRGKGRPTRELTPTLRDLRLNLRALSGTERRKAEAILALRAGREPGQPRPVRSVCDRQECPHTAISA